MARLESKPFYKDVIFDLDGTVADCAHRRKFLEDDNWAAFNSEMGEDQPNPAVMIPLNLMWSAGYRIILCSGRSEEFRKLTETWLVWNMVPYTVLYMRANKDNRKDSVVKYELYQQMLKDGYKPCLAFDDRDSVVAMWREQAKISCFQVAPGNF